MKSERYKFIADVTQCMPLDAVWFYLGKDAHDFEERKMLFLRTLKEMLDDRLILLAKHGKFLEGTADDQIAKFRDSFPDSDDRMQEGFWFFDESCPGGAVWIMKTEAGEEWLEWT